jgi:hypothetical protein
MGSATSYVVVEFCCGCHNYVYHILVPGGFYGCRSGQILYSSHLVEEWEKVIWTTIRMRNQWLHFAGVCAKHRVRIIGTKGST